MDSDISDIINVEIQKVVSQAFEDEQYDEITELDIAVAQHKYPETNAQVSHQDVQSGPSRGPDSKIMPPDPEVVQQFDPLITDGATSGESDGCPDDTVVDEEQFERMRLFVTRFHINQSHRPRRGDLVSYFDSQYEDWITVRVIGTNKKTSKYHNYFNGSESG